MSVNVQSAKHPKWPTRVWRRLAALDAAISVSPTERLQKRIAALEQKVAAADEPRRRSDDNG